MNIIFDVLTGMLIAMSIMFIFNFVRYFLKVGKIFKENKDNPNIEGIVVVNGEIKVIEKKILEEEKNQKIEMVIDPMCEKEIKKEDAYRVMIEQNEYFFCSWECREAFMKQHKKNKVL